MRTTDTGACWAHQEQDRGENRKNRRYFSHYSNALKELILSSWSESLIPFPILKTPMMGHYSLTPVCDYLISVHIRFSYYCYHYLLYWLKLLPFLILPFHSNLMCLMSSITCNSHAMFLPTQKKITLNVLAQLCYSSCAAVDVWQSSENYTEWVSLIIIAQTGPNTFNFVLSTVY